MVATLCILSILHGFWCICLVIFTSSQFLVFCISFSAVVLLEYNTNVFSPSRRRLMCFLFFICLPKFHVVFKCQCHVIHHVVDLINREQVLYCFAMYAATSSRQHIGVKPQVTNSYIALGCLRRLCDGSVASGFCRTLIF